MLKPSDIISSCHGKTSNNYSPDIFTLLSWNINKKNNKQILYYSSYMRWLQKNYNANVYCLQETKYALDDKFPLKDFCLYFAANMQLKKHAYGVMTASNINTHIAEKQLSIKKEFLLKTHKSSLTTIYNFKDGIPLIIINLHAINFKNSKIYSGELQNIASKLSYYGDIPMIIAGDFNCWSNKRVDLINKLCCEFNLKIVKFDNEHNIKKFAKKNLDMVLYKNLEVVTAHAINEYNISDHNPLLVTFKKINK